MGVIVPKTQKNGKLKDFYFSNDSEAGKSARMLQ